MITISYCNAISPRVVVLIRVGGTSIRDFGFISIYGNLDLTTHLQQHYRALYTEHLYFGRYIRLSHFFLLYIYWLWGMK